VNTLQTDIRSGHEIFCNILSGMYVLLFHYTGYLQNIILIIYNNEITGSIKTGYNASKRHLIPKH
ncbi:TPA: hypothetical protein ACGBSW_004455, partial [Salmonella enterica subsp. enterica serovar Paratyphi A]